MIHFNIKLFKYKTHLVGKHIKNSIPKSENDFLVGRLKSHKKNSFGFCICITLACAFSVLAFVSSL